jgi:predicted ATPase/DNA-binding winged helix-turn-helix (wHTH) protein
MFARPGSALGDAVRNDDRMSAARLQPKDVVSFGPFRLIASERLLTRDGVPVPLGARALDILIALVSKANEVISKRELLARVWSDVTVEESSLRFHVVSLRRALGDGEGGARYITTFAGKGYCFVGHVSRPNGGEPSVGAVAGGFTHANLPGRLIHIVGRDEDILKVSTDVLAERLVTIVGAGGVGKTTLAIAVGHNLVDAFASAVLFVDLSELNDPNLVTTAIASMLGLSVRSEDATPNLIAYLRDKRMLLILDTCEHLIEVVAALASRILLAAPEVHILATSRESLQVEGEYIYRLESLACPPDDAELPADVARRFPAPQLFVECARASGAHLNATEDEIAIVVSLCRRLDGVPLAIELAARRVEAYGLQQTAALLNQHLALIWHGQRTAPPRQRTLQATLDWSFKLLSETERVVLRQLAVFVAYFTLDAALAVATNAAVEQTTILVAIDSLVAKSMVETRPIGAMMYYRLFDTTRAYVLDIGIDDVDAADLAARHAAYYWQWLETTAAQWQTLPIGAERAPCFAGLNNARIALEWCFAANERVELGIALAAAAAPVFLSMSLFTECHRWSERAILALDGANLGSNEEMELQTCMSRSVMYIRGPSEAAGAALHRSLAIAKARGDLLNEVRLLGFLHLYHIRSGDFEVSLRCARRSFEIASTLGDAGATALAHALLGISLHLTGDPRGARWELEAAIAFRRSSPISRTSYLGFDYCSSGEVSLTTTLWLLGYPAQAMARAHQAIKDAEHIHHPVSLSMVVNAIMVLLWAGDLGIDEQDLDLFIARAESHSSKPYSDLGHALKGELAIRRGEINAGVEMLRNCVQQLHAARYGRFTTQFNIMLGRGLAASGRFDEGVTLFDETARQIETRGDISYLPEVVRLKGSIFLAMPNPRSKDAEGCFTRSLQLSRAHGLRAWELRAATDLAALWSGQGRSEDARALLLPVVQLFSEGFETADLKAAEHVLATLGQLHLS